MATVAEKQADVGTMIDDLRSLLTSINGSDGSQAWVEADSDIDNSQTDENYKNNGFVLYNDDFGIYWLAALFKENSNNSDFYDGNKSHSSISYTFSNDWDEENNIPAGLTTASSNTNFYNAVGFNSNESYQNINRNDNSQGFAQIYSKSKKDPRNNRDYQVNYFMSAGTNYVTVCSWNNINNDGEAGSFVLQRADNKFWDDGLEPWIAETRYSWKKGHVNAYSFRNFSGKTSNPNDRNFHGEYSSKDRYGVVNPDANDDTFFFQRPVYYYDAEKRIPISYIDYVIPNEIEGGLSHGDTVTADGNTYRIMKQSGGGTSDMLSLGVRYE